MSTEALRRHSKGPLRCVDNQVTHVNTRKVSKTSTAEQLRLAKGFGKHSSVLLPGSLIPFPSLLQFSSYLVCESQSFCPPKRPQANVHLCYEKITVYWNIAFSQTNSQGHFINHNALIFQHVSHTLLLIDRVTLAKTNEWISKLFKPLIVFTFLLVYISESRCYCSLYEEYSL